jgi:hypothetical protein
VLLSPCSGRREDRTFARSCRRRRWSTTGRSPAKCRSHPGAHCLVRLVSLLLVAELEGLEDIARHITAALGERTGAEHIAQRFAAALAGERVNYLDVSGLHVDEHDVLAGCLAGITDTRVLVEFVASDDEASRVEARPRGAITQIDYAGPASRWLDATDEMRVPEGCFVTVHFEHSSSLKLPMEPANSYSVSQRALSEVLKGLTQDLCI